MYPNELCGRSVLYSPFHSVPNSRAWVRSRTPRGPGTRRGACCETTPRNRSARDSPAPRTAPGSGPLQPTPYHLGRELRAVVAADPVGRPSTPDRYLGQDDTNLLGGHAPACLQCQAFTGVLLNQAQPLETSAVTGTIEDKVPCPNVVFPTRGTEVAAVGVLPVRPAQLGIGPRFGQSQPLIPPDPLHRLLVDRPALADQKRPDPPVAEPRVRAGQLLDPPGQHAWMSRTTGSVPEAGAGQVQHRDTRR